MAFPGESREFEEEKDALILSIGLEKSERVGVEPLGPELAVRCIADGYMTPTVVVPYGAEDLLDVLNSKWRELTEGRNRQDFYLLTSGPGTIRRGWLFVHDSIVENLPGRIFDATGSLEFTTCTLDGLWLYSLAKEEEGYWFISVPAPQVLR